MVTLTVIGLVMAVMFAGSKTLLPQTRLRASARNIASALERARGWAVLEGQTLEFGYDIEHRSCALWLPFATDEAGKPVGPGRTYRLEPEELAPGTAIRTVRLPGGRERDKGEVILEITPMGRVQPHEIVVFNPDYPESELLTVRVNGLSNRAQIVKGDATMEAVADVDFR